ncbi:mitochondrial F1F0 ATP synthase associated 31.2 kDa protein [Scenedesmus sp. NREL 46B-D3]|nr:mitochondrial F1F0 ATP synthase associated 31.2 kDa protein [Scenedesmus sp. NREL 46B-D3]
MALPVARQLAALALGSSSSALVSAAAPAAATSLGRGLRNYSSGAFTRKDVIYNLGNTSDPEAEAAIKAFQREQFASTSKGPAGAAAAEPDQQLAAKIERKYMAAQIVESGIQNVAVPLSYEAEGGITAVKRYLAQLQDVGAQAGFAAPAAELDAKLTEVTAGAETVKELLGQLRPYTSPDYHAALSEALAAVEAETGGAVMLDGGSAGYKKFADKVKAIAQAHKLPWQMLLPVKQKLPTADEDTADKLRKDYASWLQSAAIADAQAELAELQAEATRLLDSQLAKSAQAVKKEQQAALAAIARKVEAGGREVWAQGYKKDAEYVEWFDAAVAANPAAGPKAATV